MIELVTVQRKNLNPLLITTGKVVPGKKIAVYPDVQGRIIEISRKQGDKIHSGELLVKLSNPDLVKKIQIAYKKLQKSQK